MVKLYLIAVLLVACDDHRSVKLLLGPDDNTLSIGFQCHAPGSSKPLFEAAKQADGMYHFQIVVDFVPVSDHVPGCRGEDITRTCNKGTCEPQVGARYCRALVVTGSSPTSCSRTSRASSPPIRPSSANAPDGPVMIRAVSTLQRPRFRSSRPAATTICRSSPLGAGLRVSRPVELDHVLKVSLYLDALDTDCANLVAACATFPASTC